MLWRITVCSFFYASGIKKESKEDNMEVQEGKGKAGLWDS